MNGVIRLFSKVIPEAAAIREFLISYRFLCLAHLVKKADPPRVGSQGMGMCYPEAEGPSQPVDRLSGFGP
jgi:hypothetical protein